MDLHTIIVYIGKSNKFLSYLVDVISCYDVIKKCVQAVEQVNHFYRRTLGTNFGKSNNIGEIDGDVIKKLGFDWFAQLEIFCNGPERRSG